MRQRRMYMQTKLTMWQHPRRVSYVKMVLKPADGVDGDTFGWRTVEPVDLSEITSVHLHPTHSIVCIVHEIDVAELRRRNANRNKLVLALKRICETAYIVKNTCYESFPWHRCTRFLSLITLSRPSLTSRLKIANRSFYHSAPVLRNNLPSYLRQVVHHVTPSISNSPVSNLSISLFLKKLKTHLFPSSFPP